MKRVLCVWFPRWAIQAVQAEDPSLPNGPLVLHEERGARGSFLTHCCPQALERGLVPGMPLAEAAGLVPGLTARPYEPEKSRAALRELALACDRFTPRIALEEAEHPESLLLDIAGCDHLQGGEGPLVAEVLHEFRHRGYDVRVAVADTIGAAWAWAHYGEQNGHRVTGADRRSFRNLPVEALRLTEPILSRLQRLGLKTIGQVLKLPRETLPSRFSQLLLQRIDQFGGRRPELPVLIERPEPVEASWTFDDPVSDRHVIETALQHLLDQVGEQLQLRQLATMRVDCHWDCVRSRGPQRESSRLPRPRYPSRGAAVPRGCPLEPEMSLSLTRPGRSADHLRELASLKLERLPLPEEIQRIVVRAVPVPVPSSRQQSLFNDGSDRRQEALDNLLDRLRSRLGVDTVLWPQFVDDWVPERSVRLQSRPVGNDLIEADLSSEIAPLRLYAAPIAAEVVALQGRPMRMRWQNREERVAHCHGPHRIESGWWRGRWIRRDYYRVETFTHRRLWIFEQKETHRWYVAGE